MTETSPNHGLFEMYMTKSDSPEPNFARYSLSPSAFTKHREKLFCTESNLDQCIAYLNQELGVLGFPSLYDTSGGTHGFSIVRLTNNLYEILQLQLKSNQLKDDLEARQQRSDCDNEVLAQCQTRLKSELDLSQREVVQLEAKKNELLKTKKTLENTIKCQKEEIKKMKSNVQHLRKQFEHETRKKETEMTKMKERIIQLLNDRRKEKCLGMEILNSIQRADGRRGTWNKAKEQEEEMYRLLVNNYEERQKELIEENNDLRELLKHTEDQLVNLLNKENQDIETESRDEGCSDDDCVSVSSLTGGHYQMPLDLVREGIEKSIREKWAMLKAKIDNPKKDDSKETTKEYDDNAKIIKLTSELDKYKYIVMQQEEHIQKLQDDRSDAGKLDFLDDSLVVEEKEKIENEKKLFKSEKKTFDEERKRFTEAAIKLGHERERFSEERALFLKQQLMNSSPSPKSMAKEKYKNDEDEYRGRKLQTRTPVFSAAPRTIDGARGIITPTTEDLYNTLTLKTNKEHLLDETPRRRVSHDTSRSSSITSGNTGDLMDMINENQFSTRKSKRIDHHAHNIKKALLKQHNSLDNSTHSPKIP